MPGSNQAGMSSSMPILQSVDDAAVGSEYLYEVTSRVNRVSKHEACTSKRRVLS